VVQAPIAGGPSTPALAAAVNRARGLGFLAAGYLSTRRLGEDIDVLCGLTEGPFGVNLFVGGGYAADPARVEAYAQRLSAEALRAGVRLGEPRFDDDSFLQGVEAGGHRGVFVDDESQSELTLLSALQLVRASVDLPLVAAGSIMSGGALAAVLIFGAAAGQVGTGYLRSTEAGTSEAQRAATATDSPTLLTRAFSGRLARGLVNRWHREHGDAAPRAYPEVHHLTSSLRAQGRSAGDPDLINLWAGQAHRLAEERSAEEITRLLVAEASEALSNAAARR
jgi:nitronate monooxygenase